MNELILVIDGVPSTDHRPRARAFRRRDGRAGVSMRRSDAYEAWKDAVAAHAQLMRPAGWPLDARYAVEIVGYMPAARYDADNLRGFLDACEGVLWKNDRQCRPVVFDYRIDKARPRLEVQAFAFDPDEDDASIDIVIRRRS